MAKAMLIAAVVAALPLFADASATASRHRHLGACSWTHHGSPYPLAVPLTCSKPIDVLSLPKRPERSDFFPWSHKPYCPGARNSSDPSHQLCVYTSSEFRGHGMSVITTPELSGIIADTLDDANTPQSLRDHPSKPLGGRVNASDLAYEIKDLPGRGKGVVATRKIKKWEVIMISFPALMAPMEFFDTDNFSEKDKVKLLGRAVGRLPQQEQEAVYALARSLGGPAIEDILRTNIFGVEVDGFQYMALFPGGSRFNHACKPNVFWRYSFRTLAQEVTAMRDVEEGEELVHSYIPLGLPSRARKDALSSWGFTCRCQLCSADAETVSLSDMRRTRLYNIDHELAAEDITPEKVSQLAEELVAIIEIESLWPQLAVYYEEIAKAYMNAGDMESARKYVEKTEYTWVSHGGEEHENVDGVRELWKTLKYAMEAYEW